MVSAKERAAAVPVAKLPGKLPTATIPDDVDHESIVRAGLKYLSRGLKAEQLTEDAFWRDLLAMTGTLRCFYGNKKVEAAWKDRAEVHEPSNFVLIPGSSGVMRRGPTTAWVKAMFSFITKGEPGTVGSGMLNMVPVEGSSSWKIWCVVTVLESVQGLSNVDILEPESIRQPVSKAPAPAWEVNAVNRSQRNGSSAEISYNAEWTKRIDFDCVICGGGQAGLSIGGRLKAGGVENYVVLEKFDVIGGNWLDRYDSCKLHTSKDISQLPFGRIFPDDDPYYLTGRHLARGYQRFVDKYGINVWTSTELNNAKYDKSNKCWDLTITRKGGKKTISCRHLVLALGPGGTIPKSPKFPNQELFQGVALHSSKYKNPYAWKGKKGIVIGSANTAHDVADDMVRAGVAEVTLVQRSKTSVVPGKYMRKNIEPIYHSQTNIEVVDRIFMAMPTAVQRIFMNSGLNSQAAEDPEFYDALEKAGFKVDKDIDMIHNLYERVGGHYMDVGASQKIIDGKIKVKSDATVTSFTETGLEFSDGSKIDADVIVFGTGFDTNPRNQVVEIIGAEMESKLEDMWQCDKEGEIRGLWKPIGHPGIWYAGGGISTTRFYSRFLALQIQADLAGTPLPLYLDDPVEA